MTPDGCGWSAGQATLVPVHVSAMSHTPAAGRQMVVAGWKLSAGQAALLPVQLSAKSHTPAAERQMVPGGTN
jgi:hypothetical protein